MNKICYTLTDLLIYTWLEVFQMDAEEKKPNERLKHQRALRGWSQRKVGFEIGASKEMVSRWETGERMPSPYYQDQLCVLFGVSAAARKRPSPVSKISMLRCNNPLTERQKASPI